MPKKTPQSAGTHVPDGSEKNPLAPARAKRQKKVKGDHLHLIIEGEWRGTTYNIDTLLDMYTVEFVIDSLGDGAPVWLRRLFARARSAEDRVIEGPAVLNGPINGNLTVNGPLTVGEGVPSRNIGSTIMTVAPTDRTTGFTNPSYASQTLEPGAIVETPTGQFGVVVRVGTFRGRTESWSDSLAQNSDQIWAWWAGTSEEAVRLYRALPAASFWPGETYTLQTIGPVAYNLSSYHGLFRQPGAVTPRNDLFSLQTGWTLSRDLLAGDLVRAPNGEFGVVISVEQNGVMAMWRAGRERAVNAFTTSGPGENNTGTYRELTQRYLLLLRGLTRASNDHHIPHPLMLCPEANAQLPHCATCTHGEAHMYNVVCTRSAPATDGTCPPCRPVTPDAPAPANVAAPTPVPDTPSPASVDAARGGRKLIIKPRAQDKVGGPSSDQ